MTITFFSLDGTKLWWWLKQNSYCHICGLSHTLINKNNFLPSSFTNPWQNCWHHSNQEADLVWFGMVCYGFLLFDKVWYVLVFLIINERQDGPSLESSLYLNVNLRYFGPWDSGTFGPLDLGTLGPWDSWTSYLLQHLLILPLTSSYLLLSLPPTLLLWYGLVRGGGELWHWRMRLEMDLWPLYWS